MNRTKRKLIQYLIGLGAISAAGGYSYMALKPNALKTSSRPKLVVVGLGAYGIALVNHLRRFIDNIEIIAIDNSRDYYDRFNHSLDLVRGVHVPHNKPKEQLLLLDYQAGSQFTWYDDTVLAMDAGTNRIQTQKNGIISYDALVLAPGLQNTPYDSLSLNDPKIGSFYFDSNTTNQTLNKLKSTIRNDGQVLFHYPNTQTSSRSHFYENVLMAKFLSMYYLTGQVAAFTHENNYHPVELYSRTLKQILDLHEIDNRTDVRLAGLNPQNNTVVFTTGSANLPYNYDLLCYVPEARAPEFINQNLLGTSRLVAVNPSTLQHTQYQNIFALGDVADLNVEKSLSSISEQTKCVANNVINYFNQSPLDTSYDGHTVFAIATSKNLGYFWERNYDEVNLNAFYNIKVTRHPTKQQRIALTSITQAKYLLALKGFLV